MRRSLIITGLQCVILSAHAQHGKISLQDAIRMAQSQSSGHKLAQTRREIGGYEFTIYKSDLRPQISVHGNLPGYNKQYIPVIQPDGSILFQPIQQRTSDLGVSLSQVLPFTGGQLALNSGISQFYDFQSKYRYYNGTPVFLSLSQPLSTFNEWKWKKRIERLKLEESQRSYIQEQEDIAQQTTSLFFDLLDTKRNIQIARSNLVSDSNNYEIEQKRVNLGTTTEDRILQLQLQVLKSRQSLEKARYGYKISSLALSTFIGYTDSIPFDPVLPDDIPSLHIQPEKAVEYARLHRAEYITFEKRKLEAQRDVSRARAAGREINLTATYGLNRAAGNIGKVYTDPKDQQTFSVGVNMPIVDWGRRRARYNMAVSLEKLTDFNNALANEQIVQEIITLVTNVELLDSSIALSRAAAAVAERRFTIANSLYQTGKLTITEMNIAQSEKDNAQRSYMTALREYWYAYYLLRKLTLFDFERQQALSQVSP